MDRLERSDRVNILIDHLIRDGRLVFKVHVVPRSSRSEVAGEHNGSLRVRVAAPPVDNAANKEVIHLLAKAFKVSRSAVTILSGHNGRLKQVSIEGIPETRFAAIADKLNGLCTKSTHIASGEICGEKFSRAKAQRRKESP